MIKAQASFELFVTIGVFLAFTLPILMLLFSLSQFGLERASVIQAEGSAKKLAENINEVFVQGVNTKRPIILNLPSNTKSLSISNHQVILKVSTSAGDYEAVSPFFANVDNNNNFDIIGSNHVRTGPILLTLLVNQDRGVLIS